MNDDQAPEPAVAEDVELELRTRVSIIEYELIQQRRAIILTLGALCLLAVINLLAIKDT